MYCRYKSFLYTVSENTAISSYMMHGNSYREYTHVALRNYTCDIKSTFIYAYLYKDESYVIP